MAIDLLLISKCLKIWFCQLDCTSNHTCWKIFLKNDLETTNHCAFENLFTAIFMLMNFVKTVFSLTTFIFLHDNLKIRVLALTSPTLVKSLLHFQCISTFLFLEISSVEKKTGIRENPSVTL